MTRTTFASASAAASVGDAAQTAAKPNKRRRRLDFEILTRDFEAAKSGNL